MKQKQMPPCTSPGENLSRNHLSNTQKHPSNCLTTKATHPSHCHLEHFRKSLISGTRTNTECHTLQKTYCHWIHLSSSLHLNLIPFSRLIESSLGSVATKLNFFIHNLAQMKFASSEERPVLSFAPRVYTLKSDGAIRSLFVCRHIKTFTPSKGYVSLLHLNLAQKFIYHLYRSSYLYLHAVLCCKSGAGRSTGVNNFSPEDLRGVPWTSQ